MAAREWTRETYVAFLSIARPELRGSLRLSRRACESAGQRHLTVVVPRWLDVWTTTAPSSANRPHLADGCPRQLAARRTGRAHGSRVVPGRRFLRAVRRGLRASPAVLRGAGWPGRSAAAVSPMRATRASGPWPGRRPGLARRCDPRDEDRTRDRRTEWSRGSTRPATDPRSRPMAAACGFAGCPRQDANLRRTV